MSAWLLNENPPVSGVLSERLESPKTPPVLRKKHRGCFHRMRLDRGLALAWLFREILSDNPHDISKTD